MNVIKVKDRKELDSRLPGMPWYIEKFINYKLPDLSPSSLLEYVRDYEIFLHWLMAEGLTGAADIREVPLSDLEKLRMDAIDNFRMSLATGIISAKLPRMRTSIRC
ncbi:MAG: integrase [Paenibacillaceae bacterium]|nr:integrase [Paenibacillaceae bacterium]